MTHAPASMVNIIPDFYLPDYQIYIEYFGINRKGEVPSYFKATKGISATEAYRASMEWKRSMHREYKTIMIECYAYEKLEGNLLNSLKEKLEAASVCLSSEILKRTVDTSCRRGQFVA